MSRKDYQAIAAAIADTMATIRADVTAGNGPNIEPDAVAMMIGDGIAAYLCGRPVRPDPVRCVPYLTLDTIGGNTMTVRYQSIQVSPDGQDYILDHERETVDDVWDAVNDQGSRWYFYPIPFVVTSDGKRHQSGAAILRKRIIDAPQPFDYLKGCTVKTAMSEIANDPEFVAAILS